MKIKSFTPKNSAYPALLREIAHPPKKLYYLGTPTSQQPTLAFVGSRHFSAYGQQVTYKLAYELAAAGLTIVSGLALGIDTIAHRAALEAGGVTWAVEACGLDQIYPASNRGLAKRILASGGAIFSEYPGGTPPLKHNFPARNRIIAGLSLGVVVSEAPARSGALITANFSLEQNRQVMAVPGNITSLSSAGANSLIKAGAIPITEAADVLAALDLAAPKLKTKLIKPASQAEAVILDLLAQDINDAQELISRSGFAVSHFNQVISLMEISGKVRSLGGGKWAAR